MKVVGKIEAKKGTDAMLAACADLVRDKEGILEMIKMEAEFKWNKYNYLIQNGFKESDALFLCKESALTF